MTLSADAPPRECDVAIIGAGIIGLAIAREVMRRRQGVRLCVLERERRLGAHQTGRSSGVIHAGVYYEPGGLKARLCVEGARELYAHCEERDIGFQRSGKLIVATAEGEVEALVELERRGLVNGVPGLRRLSAGEIAAVEPHAEGLSALHSPSTGITDFGEVARSYGEEAISAGATLHLGAGVESARPVSGGIRLSHSHGDTVAKSAVFSAGLWSDRLAVSCGAPKEPRIVPFRGAYLRVDPARADLVRSNIYPVPDPALPFLGAHLTRTLSGDLLIGPSALMVGARDAYALRRVRPRDLAETVAWPGTWRLGARNWRTGLTELRRAASKRSFLSEAARFVPALADATVSVGPVGIRAQALGRDGALVDDFVVHRTEHAIHVRNAPSPAATASLPLARMIVDELDSLS